MIKVNNIHKSYGSVEVLKGIDLEISKAEIVSIVGKSGAGKTTLLQIIGTLLDADKGTIIINETEVSKLKERLENLLFAKYNAYHKLSVYLFIFTITSLAILAGISICLIQSGYINRVTAFILGMSLVSFGIILVYANLKVAQLVDYWYSEYESIKKLGD